MTVKMMVMIEAVMTVMMLTVMRELRVMLIMTRQEDNDDEEDKNDCYLFSVNNIIVISYSFGLRPVFQHHTVTKVIMRLFSHLSLFY